MADNVNPPPYRGPQYVIPQGYVLGGIEFLTCFACLCYALYVLCFWRRQSASSSNYTLSRTLQYLTLCGVVCFVLDCVCQTINIYFWNTYYWTFSDIQTATWYSSWFLWSLGIFISYVLFLHRIQSTFNDSAFAPSRKTLAYLYILLSLYALLWILVCFYPFLMYIPNGGVSRSDAFEINSTLSIPITLLDLAIAVSMTYMFVSRLYRLILLQTINTFEEQKQALVFANHRESYMNHIRLSPVLTNNFWLIQVSTKIATLSITSLLSSLLLISLRAVSFDMSYESPIAKCAAIWLQFDTMISCVCLVLFLPKTERAFDVLCYCCSSGLTKCMEESVKRSTVRESEEQVNPLAIIEDADDEL